MKKFEQLGRSLSKQEQKKVMGGTIDPGGGNKCNSACSGSCTLSCGGTTISGNCFISTGKCYCSGAC